MGRQRRRARTLPALTGANDHQPDRGTEHSLRSVIDCDGAVLRAPLSERENRADPTDPNVTVAGARRHDGLRQLWRAGRLSGKQWWAAERFRDDLALAAGARPELPDPALGRVSGGAPCMGPSEVQIDAMARCRGAWQAMGLEAAGLVSWVVVSAGTVDDYDSARAQRKGRSMETLLSALDCLDVYYQGIKLPI